MHAARLDTTRTPLGELLELARRRAAEEARVLNENIADLFLSPEGRLSDREAALMSHALQGLIHEVEMAVRRDLVERLGEVSDVSYELIVTLANAEIEAAYPILYRSGVLRHAGLVAVIKDRIRAHMLQLARREAAEDAMGAQGAASADYDLAESLAGDSDATLSRRALAYLVDRARRLDRFQRPRVLAADMPAEIAQRAFWWVSAALRQYVAAQFPTDPLVLDDHIRDSAEAALDRVAREAGRPDPTRALIAALADRGGMTKDFVLRCLRQGEVRLFLAAFAQLARIEPEPMRRIVFDPGGEPLAVACRAIGMTGADFAATFVMTRMTGPGGPVNAVPSTLVKLFERLSRNDALAALAFWRHDDPYFAAQSAIAAGSAA